MLRELFPVNIDAPPSGPQEGDLYKIVNIHGRSFPLYYGYYEECDRANPVVDPMPIYPDFLESPQYTADGLPFVTKMQDACSHYQGNQIQDRDCAECAYYKHGDELLGICVCINNRVAPTTEENSG